MILRVGSSRASWRFPTRKSPACWPVLGEFAGRHEHVEEFFLNRFPQVKHSSRARRRCRHPERQLLIGAHFTNEYSPEPAALFNPSIVPHPDQAGLPEGQLRFILSLRATGEGHVSSITFRTGKLGAQNRIALDAIGPVCGRAGTRAERGLHQGIVLAQA